MTESRAARRIPWRVLAVPTLVACGPEVTYAPPDPENQPPEVESGSISCVTGDQGDEWEIAARVTDANGDSSVVEVYAYLYDEDAEERVLSQPLAAQDDTTWMVTFGSDQTGLRCDAAMYSADIVATDEGGAVGEYTLWLKRSG